MGQKAFKTSEKFSRWPSRGRPPLPAGPDKPDDGGGAAGDPERGAGWTMAESVRWPVHTTQHPPRLFSSSMARHFFFSTFKLLITCLPLACDHSLAVANRSTISFINRGVSHGPRHPVLNLLLPADDEKLLNFTVSPVPPHAE